MKVSYVEDIASHSDSESCAFVRKERGEALTGGGIGPGIEPRNMFTLERRRRGTWRKATRLVTLLASYSVGSARSETLSMCSSTLHGSREVPRLVRGGALSRIRNSKEVPW